MADLLRPQQAINPAVRHQWLTPLKIASIYAIFAALWIIFSDYAIELLALNKNMLSTMQTWKGLFFVSITALMVFVLVRIYFQQQQALIGQLNSNRQRLNLILDSVPGGIRENDLSGRITYSNPGYQQIMDYPPESLLHAYVWDFEASDSDAQQLREYFFHLVKHQPTPEPYISHCLTRHGQERITEINWGYQYDSEGQLSGLISVISDITQIRQQEQEIAHLAYYDPLTGLPNRFRSLEQLDKQIRTAGHSGEQLAVMVLDLDHFKKVNDSLGHDTGDRLLQALVLRLQKTLQPQQMLGRLGGDEFIILQRQLPETETLSALIESTLSPFNQAFSIENREMMLPASVGVAIYPDDGVTASELLRNADSAMFHAKDSGRNTFSYFTRTMNVDVARRFSIEEQLHSALDQNQFSLVYQPQIALNNERITGVEALIRWHNPLLGQVSPDEFIPVAEQSSLILSIGRFVLAQSIAMLADIQQSQSDFRMAINLSPIQFRDTSLVDTIERLIHEHQLAPSTLELEITEGVLLSGAATVKATLQALSELGVSLAMDDFGTGYSSLSYLRNYPFDVLKIDRSFIADIADDPAERELINAIVAMSQGLGIRVVAEGVETAAQRDFLETVGCDYAQGYYFRKPLPAEGLKSLLSES